MTEVLQNILEELEHEILENKEIGRKQCEGIAMAINIIRSHIDKKLDRNNVEGLEINIDRAIDLLKNMQNPKIDYADMVLAPYFCYGKKYVYPDPEDYAIETAINALQEKKKYNWIPVKERLPREIGQYVLGTTVYGEMVILKYDWNIPHSKKMFFHLSGTAANVIAWKLLPEAYRAADKSDWKENMLNTFLAGH